MDPILEPLPPAPGPAPARQRIGRRGVAVAAAFGAVLLGGAIAATSLGGSDTALAATSTASPSPSASTAPGNGPCGRGGLGPNHEAVSDTSVAAKAIGITESELTTALQGGQTIAAVAKAHNVDVQKVIDALVADENTEIATALKNGTITQAQADAEKAQVTARVTAQVNGTFGPGMGGDHGGRGPGDGWTPPAASPSATPNA